MLCLCPAVSLDVPGVPAGDKRDAPAQPGIPLTFLSIPYDVGVSSGYKIQGSFELSLGEEWDLRLAVQTAQRRADGAVFPWVTAAGPGASLAQMAAASGPWCPWGMEPDVGLKSRHVSQVLLWLGPKTC